MTGCLIAHASQDADCTLGQRSDWVTFHGVFLRVFEQACPYSLTSDREKEMLAIQKGWSLESFPLAPPGAF